MSAAKQAKRFIFQVPRAMTSVALPAFHVLRNTFKHPKNNEPQDEQIVS
jgi:hypothetical protein